MPAVAMSYYNSNRRSAAPKVFLCALAIALVGPTVARSQQSSISAWDAADFRVWAYIPYWTTQTQINNFGTNGMYSHVSDVISFGAYRTDSNGNLAFVSSAYQTQVNTIRAQSAQYGFNMGLSMFEVN